VELGLGNDPDFGTVLSNGVRAQHAKTLANGELVFPGVLGHYFTPVTALLAGQKLSEVGVGVRKQRDISALPPAVRGRRVGRPS